MDAPKRTNPAGSPKLIAYWILILAIVFAIAPQHRASAQQATLPKQGSLVVKDGKFLMDSRPYQILSGEIHYARVPREYWRDRLKKAKAMGLNTISVYDCWHLHE